MAKTIYDVARAAGVSHTSVSAVLNNKPIRVREETRQRIVAAAKSLGYQANRVAQQLSTGRFHTIGLCFVSTGTNIFANWNMNQLIAGIVHCASENELSVLFAPTKEATPFEEKMGRLPSQGVDGAVVVGPLPLHGDAAASISKCGVPAVCIDSQPNLGPAITVDSDNFLGMKQGVQHLIAAGHKRLAYIGPQPELQCLVERMTGFYQAVQGAGLSLADQATHIVSLEEVPAIMKSTAEAADGPTAVICADQRTLMRALEAASQLGIKVPGEMSILGYDDVPHHPMLDCINIVRNDFFGVGIRAVEALVKLISGECSAPVALRVPPELDFRTS